MKKCEVCNSTHRVYRYKRNGKNLCNKHYLQMAKNGKILDRTIKDRNEIICRENVCEMKIYDKNCNVICTTSFDKQFLKKVQNLKWCLSTKGYVWCANKKIWLHHLILPKKDCLVTDHINGNKLDNRKSNLRYATNIQNQQNQKTRRGYCWCNTKKRWRAYIDVNKKRINLGYFLNKKEAATIRRKAELKYFGEFAPKRSQNG